MVDLVRDKRDVYVLDDLCRRFCVRRLELFGSALRQNFDQRSSDIDLLVEFADPVRMNRAL